MNIFRCERCGHEVDFAATECPSCHAQLGYVAEQRTIKVLHGDAASAYTIEGDEQVLWRCLNSAWGCNWVLPAGSGSDWCRSCRLTRGRPDDARPAAIEAWMSAEAAKRHLVHQLDVLGLPLEARSESAPDGLAFDLVHLPGEGGITGHMTGVVTLDLAETDEHHRESLRRQLGEPFRTVIGHLRHEIGHHYWAQLVGRSDEVTEFRRLFGDERAEYGEAVERYYRDGAADRAPNRYVTAYAASHPLEDWAETFAHYLHIIDMIDSGAAYGLIGGRGADDSISQRCTSSTFDDILGWWRPLVTAVNAVAGSVGSPAVYPFWPEGAVIDKLDFVHQRVCSFVERG